MRFTTGIQDPPRTDRTPPGPARSGEGRARRIPAHGILFPAAAAYAAVALPMSVAAMLGTGPRVPGLASPAGHAHEMLFGFALAVVAGNQLGPMPRARLALVVATWIAARVAFLASPGGLATGLANAAFAALVAAHLVPRVGAVRKWRNRALPAAVVALCVAAAAMQPALRLASSAVQETTLLAGVLLLALLMLFMGGRIVAPAAAGHFLRAGGDLAARVQPRLEGAIVAAMALAVASLVAGAHTPCAVFVAMAACLAAVRLVRWRPWSLRRRRDIAALFLGYAWLVAGLASLAAAVATGTRPIVAIHLLTVGAMGTLTVNVMALTWARLARRDPATLALPSIATAAIALATVARVAAAIDAPRAAAWLAVAAGAWTAAYALLLATFARLPRGAGRPAS